MDSLVHFEIPADDLDRAKKFYSSIFGWKLDDWNMPDGSVYVGAHTTPIDEKTRMPLKPGAINGAIVQRDAALKAPVFAIDVPSIDDYIGKIEKSGGTVVRPKVEIMGMGYYAYVSDTEGNTIGLWENLKK